MSLRITSTRNLILSIRSPHFTVNKAFDQPNMTSAPSRSVPLRQSSICLPQPYFRQVPSQPPYSDQQHVSPSAPLPPVSELDQRAYVRIELLRHPPTPHEAIRAALVDAIGPNGALSLADIQACRATFERECSDWRAKEDEKATLSSRKTAAISTETSSMRDGAVALKDTRERKSCEPRLRNTSATTSHRQRREILTQLNAWMEELDEHSEGLRNGFSGSKENSTNDTGTEMQAAGAEMPPVSKPNAVERRIIYRHPMATPQTNGPAILKERCWSVGSLTELRVVNNTF